MTRSQVSFVAVRFADLSGWEEDDHAAAIASFVRSCDRLTAAASPRAASGQDAARDLASLCGEARALAGSGADGARRFFEARFTPHRVVHERPQGLLTGYYEPVLAGSRTRQGRYQTPVYRRPPDLVNLVDESMRGTTGAALTHARKAGDGVAPYATRAEIESGALAGRGLELLYLADPVEAFFMHVQGSGLIVLSEGASVRLTYDGKNGHPYTSIGRYLVETGTFTADQVTMDALTRWLQADPERGRQAMWQNASYVFFRELAGSESQSALGVMGIPLTPGRSLAVDAGVHVLGTPIYVVAPGLHGGAEGRPFQRLMIAQDVGSAIRGPERGDIYFGSGPEAGQRAGTTRHAGNFYVLLPRGAPKAACSP
ncbi:MAG: MltA domain-containing protein [Hyphomicrobiaceae bacterium]|nr:MltA domain-containing protein [Hyphomicrobiaceae bacterium]